MIGEVCIRLNDIDKFVSLVRNLTKPSCCFRPSDPDALHNDWEVGVTALFTDCRVCNSSNIPYDTLSILAGRELVLGDQSGEDNFWERSQSAISR